MSKVKKLFLSEHEMPKQWYNIAADLPGTMNPPLGPDGNPVGPEMLAPVFPMNLIEQEVSQERWIDIPEKVLEMLSHLASGPPGKGLCPGRGPGYSSPDLLQK